jgi:hypothetical protein
MSSARVQHPHLTDHRIKQKEETGSSSHASNAKYVRSNANEGQHHVPHVLGEDWRRLAPFQRLSQS